MPQKSRQLNILFLLFFSSLIAARQSKIARKLVSPTGRSLTTLRITAVTRREFPRRECHRSRSNCRQNVQTTTIAIIMSQGEKLVPRTRRFSAPSLKSSFGLLSSSKATNDDGSIVNFLDVTFGCSEFIHSS